MRKGINFIHLLVIILLFSSCGAKKESKTMSKQKFDLENYLTQNGYIKIEMDKMATGHLRLSAQVNGVDGDFVLDTGAGVTVVDKKSKEKLKMQSADTKATATGAGGTDLQLENSEKNNFKIGELEIIEQALTLMSLDHVNNAFEANGLKRVDGVIGSDILTARKAVIDFSKIILYLKNTDD